MRQREAFEATLSMALGRGWTTAGGQEPLTPAHAVDMLRRWDDTFSDAKGGRWLGWLQGVLCALGYVSLDEAKQINMAHADDNPSAAGG
jgi:hypothetical protein